MSRDRDVTSALASVSCMYCGGGVLGGFIGALGSALAVFLTLRCQRRDEAKSIRDAARREIQEFSRSVTGNLDTCREIAAGPTYASERSPPGQYARPMRCHRGHHPRGLSRITAFHPEARERKGAGTTVRAPRRSWAPRAIFPTPF